jgi:hypothetical protein
MLLLVIPRAYKLQYKITKTKNLVHVHHTMVTLQLSLCLIKHQAIKVHTGKQIEFHAFYS